MKKPILSLLRLAIVTLATFPVFALAAPPATSPYNTDVTNSYVQDQTSQVMSSLNNILCFMGAMEPDQMVNLTTNSGNYIALVDQNTCGGNGGSGGKSNNTGPDYVAAVVNSTRASNTAPMLVKAWVSPQPGDNITVYVSATQEPSTTLPYGAFRMDYCGNATGATGCATDKGFINATTSGLAFYSAGNYGGGSETTALQLNASSTTAGSGVISNTNSWTGAPVTSTFSFAYDSAHFVRNDGTTTQCFDRSPTAAAESVWRYGLYDATTGAQINRNSGFPIEYTAAGVTSNGYVGYNGLWMPVTVPSGATVNQVTYGASGATKTPYTLLKTGGKLLKYTTATKTLAALHKIAFWYFASANIPATGTPTMTAGSQYELYWDDTAKQFMVSGKQNTTTFNMEPYTTPVAVANADMVAANSWGLFGWSQMLGGQFSIKGTDFSALATTTSTTKVLTQIEDVVYPSQYAAIGGLSCINDCPTLALISASNATTPTSATPFVNPGWTPTATLTAYTLDTATGNLVDGANGQVVSAATTGLNANGVRSGRMVDAAGLTAIKAAKNCGANCTTYNQGDVDLLAAGSVYYVWQTGGQPWDQLAILMSGTTPVKFDPPLAVNFVVPVAAKYGSYQGATISLEYGGFGDLWGIPSTCVDVATNSPCVFGTTPSQNQRWTPKFSIPFDPVVGVVTTAIAQGTVAASTQYLVKPLDKEVRLANVGTAVCTTAGLTAPVISSVTLPASTSFVDPTPLSGAKPTFATVPAPQVIHGVKQY